MTRKTAFSLAVALLLSVAGVGSSTSAAAGGGGQSRVVAIPPRCC